MSDQGFGGKYDGKDDYDVARVGRLPGDVLAGEFRAFEELTQGKMDFGDQKYGPDSWAHHDQLTEAMGEMIDLANYAFLTWRQLKHLREKLDLAGVPRSLTGEDRVGVQPPPAVAEHIHEPSPYAVCAGCREASRP